MVRIGIDRPAGAATGDLDTLTAHDQKRQAYPRVTFAEVRDAGEGDLILDVRRDDEYAAGHVPGSVHVPVHQLLSRINELSTGRLWVHCASGFRASIAASLLDRAGLDVILIDDDYRNAIALGLTTS
jgi:rhodanese-related sulfurtransferase